MYLSALFIITLAARIPFLGQTDPVAGWGDVLATYGPFAPFAFLLLWLLQLLWKDNKEKEAEIKRLTETAMEKVLPVVLDATKVINDAHEAVKRATLTGSEIVRLHDGMNNLSDELDSLKSYLRKAERERERERNDS